MASRRHDIIRPITPWVQKEEGFETRKNVDNRRETVKWGKEREIETKHINSGIGGLTAHILFCFFLLFFSGKKQQQPWMCSQWIYNYKPEQIESHTHKQQQQQQQQLKLAYSTLWVNGNKIPQWMSADVFDTNSHFPICCLIEHDEWWESGRRRDEWQHLGSIACPIDSPSLLLLQPSWLLLPSLHSLLSTEGERRRNWSGVFFLL